MDLKSFTQLYERIQTEPSILLLGQQYLSIGGHKDLLWEKIATELYPDLDLPRKKASYPTLWEKVVKTPADANKLMEQIVSAGEKVEQSDALKAIVNLRWSLLYTSAIDGTTALQPADGCTFVPQSEKDGRLQYLSKERNYRVNLCGTTQQPPVLTDEIDLDDFSDDIGDKIRWIQHPYLEYYGVLIIDGFDPEYDWINDSNLFRNLRDMPQNSIFWFNAPAEIGKVATRLVNDGILRTESEGFYEHMLRHMPEMLEQEPSLYEEMDPAFYASLTLRMNNKQTHTLQIRRSDISNITGANLCIIDDEVLAGNPRPVFNRAQLFADFLTQNNLPSWHLFTSRNGDTPFYFPRTKDTLLLNKTYEALQKNGVNRRPVLISGPSNSGKSMMLANLALKVASERKYPVIFIRGDLVHGAETRLEEFINNWFCAPERTGEDRISKTLVVWDGGGLKRTERDYELLQNKLFHRNVQIVGSVYSVENTSANNIIHIDQKLDEAETNALGRVLRSLGGGYAERFNQIQNKLLGSTDHANPMANRTLLYLLQALFKYEFDAEYRDLSLLLSRQFNQEKSRAEIETAKNLEEYVQNFIETQKKIAQSGMASSFQEKMLVLAAQLAEKERNATTDSEKAEVDKEKQRMAKLKELQNSIKQMNNVLAVASEFGVQLPLRLLLRFLRDNNDNHYFAYNEETVKIIDILKEDTLIEFTCKNDSRFGDEYYVGFRNSMEAENYICLLCDLPLESHDTARKAKEVELLCQIIRSAEDGAELRTVIELVRQFGPNGHGMLSELDNERNSRYYGQYFEHWLTIASALYEQFPTDPEVVLLYAHLTREFIVLDSLENETRASHYAEYTERARTLLEEALTRLENAGQTSAQYDRLSVELCANYQQTMRENGFNPVIYQGIKTRIRNVFGKTKQSESADLRKNFTSNSLLDILLNSFDSYRKSPASQNAEAFDQELAEIVNDIDQMLSLDDLLFEKKARADDRIKKIRDIYHLVDPARMKQLQENLTMRSSDALLYMQARMIWQENIPDKMDNLRCTDPYLVLCHDFLYDYNRLPEQLTAQAKINAQKVINFLEAPENDDIIRATKSDRSVAMLMRAKWFLKTGGTMLAEKQQIAFTREEWDQINALCDRYLAYNEVSMQTTFIPAYFLKGVYEWTYGDPRNAKEYFELAKAVRNASRIKNGGSEIEYLVLCAEGSTAPRTFKFSFQKKETGKYTAQIRNETTQPLTGAPSLVDRFGMLANHTVVKALFDGTMPMEEHTAVAPKEGIIRFNLIGASVGFPHSGGGSNG